MLESACHIVAGELVEASLDAALNPAPSSPSLKHAHRELACTHRKNQHAVSHYGESDSLWVIDHGRTARRTCVPEARASQRHNARAAVQSQT
jgi:hypothetical protein